MSTKALALRLDDGRVLRGFAGAVEIEHLKTLLGTLVVVEGSMTFRPSGDPLRVEVESAAPAAPGDVIWAQVRRIEPVAARPRAAPTSTGLEGLFGKWPGDETDEELAAALRQLS